MRGLTPMVHDDLILGPEGFGDAGVFRIAPGLALVQSVDFFPPVVDDPYTYGRIAAANALGDIYALGATPKTALNIVGFPDTELELDILTSILQGGAERVLAAGAVTVGGHSVRDNEVKFGLSVTGTADPDRILTNARARAGDAIVLTKPLGTGFITTANRADRCPQQTLDACVTSMIALNDTAARAALDADASAATDVTGFGLAGHAAEMATASGVTIEISLAALPAIDGGLDLALPENTSGGGKTNIEHARPMCDIDPGAQGPRLDLIYDPQTSGGLLIAAPESQADAIVEALAATGLPAATIGRVTNRADTPLRILP